MLHSPIAESNAFPPMMMPHNGGPSSGGLTPLQHAAMLMHTAQHNGVPAPIAMANSQQQGFNKNNHHQTPNGRNNNNGGNQHQHHHAPNVPHFGASHPMLTPNRSHNHNNGSATAGNTHRKQQQQQQQNNHQRHYNNNNNNHHQQDFCGTVPRDFSSGGGNNNMMMMPFPSPFHHHQQQQQGFNSNSNNNGGFSPCSQVNAGGHSPISPSASQHQQYTAAAPAADRAPLSRRFEQDALANATREELLQILLDLSYFSPDAAKFIECKAQVFALRQKPHHQNQQQQQQQQQQLASQQQKQQQKNRAAEEDGEGQEEEAEDESGPVAEGAARNLFDSASACETPNRPSNPTNANGESTAKKSLQLSSNSLRQTPMGAGQPYSPSHNSSVAQGGRSVERGLAERRLDAATRPFSTEIEQQQQQHDGDAEDASSATTVPTRHPCLRTYGNCRHPASCAFVDSPYNLCLAWVRGTCPSGRDCALVHRLPEDCNDKIRHLYDVSRLAEDAGAFANPLPSEQKQQRR